MSRAALVSLALLCAGCTTAPPRCATGQEAAVNELIYFGTATPDGVVSADAWNGFLRDVVKVGVGPGSGVRIENQRVVGRRKT